MKEKISPFEKSFLKGDIKLSKGDMPRFKGSNPVLHSGFQRMLFHWLVNAVSLAIESRFVSTRISNAENKN